jgi:hypothetical protein
MEDRHSVARQEGLIVEDLGGELLVYDADSCQAHSLDARASAIWRACDGTRSAGAIAEFTGVSEDEVWLTLTRLEALDLLSRPAAEAPSQTRRTLLRRGLTAGAVGALAAPIIKTIVAPAPADAVTAVCTPDNQPCDLDNPGACCSDICCNFNPPNPPVCCSG